MTPTARLVTRRADIPDGAWTQGWYVASDPADAARQFVAQHPGARGTIFVREANVGRRTFEVVAVREVEAK